MDPRQQVTALILHLREGEPGAWDQLLPLVYEELRAMAHRQVSRQRVGHTLNTTALVHETYIRLVDGSRMSFADRAHFFAVAACAMRQVLIDHARRYRTAKRGGELQRVPMDDVEVLVEERADALIALDDALTRLTRMNERLGRVVECRFFGGMTEEETAAALGVTDRTVRRDWTKAKLWLQGEMSTSAA